jgi:hypothetical protein
MTAKTTAATVWHWALAVLPVTAFITFIVILVACNLVSGGGKLLQISDIGIGNAYVYSIAGLVMLLPQILLIIISRLQYLLQTQGIINEIILYIIHIVTLIPFVFMLIVAFVGRGHRSDTRVLGTYGIFGSIALYCFLHTIIVFYLYKRRATGAHYSKLYLPIWFLIWSLLLIVFFVVWLNTNVVIAGYIAAAAPFFYFLGFVPQFWARARSRNRYAAVSKITKILDG